MDSNDRRKASTVENENLVRIIRQSSKEQILAQGRLEKLPPNLLIVAKRLARRSANSTQSYLLCRPRGGLNDILVQIQKCLLYASLHRRKLLVDTTRSGLRDSLSSYFEWKSQFCKATLNSNRISQLHLDELSCFPEAVEGCVSSYQTEFLFQSETFSLIGEASSRQPTTFDFSCNYPNKILIHEQEGGGAGWHALRHLRFCPTIAALIKKRLKLLPVKYIGIHIRNTDVKTDFARFCEAIMPHVVNQCVFISTDSHEALIYARRVLRHSNILSFSELPSEYTGKLHDAPGITSMQTNIDALCDLVCLSLAETILLPGPEIGYQSGFGNLAASLLNRRWITRRLLYQHRLPILTSQANRWV